MASDEKLSICDTWPDGHLSLCSNCGEIVHYHANTHSWRTGNDWATCTPYGYDYHVVRS